jgi:hypothetical protein
MLTEDYKTVLIFASGLNIAAQVPYLKRLLYGYKPQDVCTRRIHIIWQFEDIGKVSQRTS